MIAAIVYNSSTGSCERYAKELSRTLHIPAYPVHKAPTRSDGEFVFVSWIMAGGLQGYKQAAKRMKIAAVVAVGMAPASEKTASAIRQKCAIPQSVGVFCVQGGFHLNRLSAPMKLIMKVKTKDIVKQLEKKKEAVGSLNAQEQALYRMAKTGEGEPADWDVSTVTKWVLDKYRKDGILHV